MADKILAWNTGRIYTEKGQRIAAIQIGGGVFLSDQDRGIHYYLPGCPLEQREIMRRYDYNENCEWSLPDRNMNRWEVIEKLDAASKNETTVELQEWAEYQRIKGAHQGDPDWARLQVLARKLNR